MRYIEPRLVKADKPDALGTPDILLLLSEQLAVVDNLSGKLYLIVFADPAEANAYERALQRLQQLARELRRPFSVPEEVPMPAGQIQLEFAEADFLRAVERAKRSFDGDIMQVVLSQRSAIRIRPRRCRCIAPCVRSTLALHVLLRHGRLPGGRCIAGDPGAAGAARSRAPIAGIVRDRAAPRANRIWALEQDLLADPKERAEHVMLMDLGRNDVGRVASAGSVRVTENMVVERYSHVMHIVSNVDGRLRPGLMPSLCLAPPFPGGHGEWRTEGARDGDHRRIGPAGAACMPVRSVISASTATWIWPSPSAPQ